MMSRDNSKKPKLYVGIDEAGRGPLAGPVFVAAVAAKKRVLITSFFPEIRDSKALSPIMRKEVFAHLTELQKKGGVAYAYSFVGSSLIDRDGISKSVYLGVARCLHKLHVAYDTSLVLLDGALHAPRRYLNQKTIIRGDEKEMLIALASIVAKVKRDEKMERMELKFPGYALAQHKGYGTKLHFNLLRKHGASDLHRKSFIKSVNKKREIRK